MKYKKGICFLLALLTIASSTIYPTSFLKQCTDKTLQYIKKFNAIKSLKQSQRQTKNSLITVSIIIAAFAPVMLYRILSGNQNPQGSENPKKQGSFLSIFTMSTLVAIPLILASWQKNRTSQKNKTPLTNQGKSKKKKTTKKNMEKLLEYALVTGHKEGFKEGLKIKTKSQPGWPIQERRCLTELTPIKTVTQSNLFKKEKHSTPKQKYDFAQLTIKDVKFIKKIGTPKLKIKRKKKTPTKLTRSQSFDKECMKLFGGNQPITK